MFCDNAASKQEKVSTGESVLVMVVFRGVSVDLALHFAEV